MEVGSRLLTSEGHQSHAVQLYEEICTALYKATESAAIAFTTNKKIWELFNKVRNESATAAAISAVAAGKNVFGLWKGEKSTVGIGINAVCLAFNAWKCYESYCEMRDANSIMEYLRGSKSRNILSTNFMYSLVNLDLLLRVLTDIPFSSDNQHHWSMEFGQ